MWGKFEIFVKLLLRFHQALPALLSCLYDEKRFILNTETFNINIAQHEANQQHVMLS